MSVDNILTTFTWSLASLLLNWSVLFRNYALYDSRKNADIYDYRSRSSLAPPLVSLGLYLRMVTVWLACNFLSPFCHSFYVLEPNLRSSTRYAIHFCLYRSWVFGSCGYKQESENSYRARTSLTGRHDAAWCCHFKAANGLFWPFWSQFRPNPREKCFLAWTVSVSFGLRTLSSIFSWGMRTIPNFVRVKPHRLRLFEI